MWCPLFWFIKIQNSSSCIRIIYEEISFKNSEFKTYFSFPLLSQQAKKEKLEVIFILFQEQSQQSPEKKRRETVSQSSILPSLTMELVFGHVILRHHVWMLARTPVETPFQPQFQIQKTLIGKTLNHTLN